MSRKENRSKLSAWLMRLSLRVAPKNTRIRMLGGPLDGASADVSIEADILPVDFAYVNIMGLPVRATAVYGRTPLLRDGLRLYLYAGENLEQAVEDAKEV